jgi:hypothetical protein
MTKVRPLLRAAAAGLGLMVALSACDDTGTNPDVEAAALEARLFDAMNQDDFASAGAIVGALWEFRDQNPTHHRNEFLLGAANLWWIVEASRPDAGVPPVQIIKQAIPNILEAFGNVYQNDSENRPGAAALLGAFLFETGLDRRTGWELVDSASVWAPEVGIFQQMHTRRFAPADDTATASAIERGFRWWEACVKGPVDRNNPDFTGRVKPPSDESYGNFCWGSARVPHGFEGSMMIFGDLLVKGGKFEAARRAYLNARLSSNYNRWKFKDALEQRLASDLRARQATYFDRDPYKWAPIGVPEFSCTQCHASIR